MPRAKSDRTIHKENLYGAPIAGEGMTDEIAPVDAWSMPRRVHVGTSGWAYRHWLGRVYPRTLPSPELLAFYARRFDTVEVNSTYYRLPPESTFDAWRAAVPPGFRFTIKAPGAITHEKRLRDVKAETAQLFERCARLGPKLGVILFQLPPGLHADLDLLKDFLDLLPSERTFAMEFRHRSWWIRGVRRMLEASDVAWVVHDFNKKGSPLWTTSGAAYLRLHGATGRYRGSYDEETILSWAEAVRAWHDEGREVWCYLNNDERGKSARNAVALREALPQRWTADHDLHEASHENAHGRLQPVR